MEDQHPYQDKDNLYKHKLDHQRNALRQKNKHYDANIQG